MKKFLIVLSSVTIGLLISTLFLSESEAQLGVNNPQDYPGYGVGVNCKPVGAWCSYLSQAPGTALSSLYIPTLNGKGTNLTAVTELVITNQLGNIAAISLKGSDVDAGSSIRYYLGNDVKYTINYADINGDILNFNTASGNAFQIEQDKDVIFSGNMLFKKDIPRLTIDGTMGDTADLYYQNSDIDAWRLNFSSALLSLYGDNADVIVADWASSGIFRAYFNGNLTLQVDEQILSYQAITPAFSITDLTANDNAVYYTANGDYGSLSINRNSTSGQFKNDTKAHAQLNLYADASQGRIEFYATNTVNVEASIVALINQNGLGVKTNGYTQSFAVAGDAVVSGIIQHRTNIVSQTFNGQTTDATPLVLASFAMPTASGVTIETRIIGRQSAGGASTAGYFARAVAENPGGTTALIGAVDQLVREDVAGWDGTITVDDTTDVVRVLVTGAAATTINWSASVSLVWIK